MIQSPIHSRSGRVFALVLARTRIPAATPNAIVQWIVPPPKFHVERLVPGVTIAPEAQLAGMAVIQRGGKGDDRLEPDEALETLMDNCEDAYGFPPYPAIEESPQRQRSQSQGRGARDRLQCAVGSSRHRDAERDHGLVRAPAGPAARRHARRRQRQGGQNRSVGRRRTGARRAPFEQIGPGSTSRGA